MDNQAPQSTVLDGTILEWLSNEALQDSEPGALYGELCQRLRVLPAGRGPTGPQRGHELIEVGSAHLRSLRVAA